MSPQEEQMEQDSHTEDASAESSIGTENENSRIRIVSPEKAEPEDNDSTEDEESLKQANEAKQQDDTLTLSPKQEQPEHNDDSTEDEEDSSVEEEEEESVEAYEIVQPDGVNSTDGTAVIVSSQAEEQTAEDYLEEDSVEAKEIEEQGDGATTMSPQETHVEENCSEEDDDDDSAQEAQIMEDGSVEESIEANATHNQDGEISRSPQEAQILDDSSVDDDSVAVNETVQPDGVESCDNENFKVMHESNQTEEERRQIRKTQRTLHTKIVEAGDDVDIDEIRGENNDIFSQVCYPREAVLDGVNMSAIGSRAALKADRLFKAPRYDADKLVRKLVSKCQTREGFFDWDAFGTQAGTCFNAMPANISFMNGSLTYIREIKVSQRGKRRRIEEEEEDVEEERPEEIRQRTDGNADQLSAIQRNLRSMKHTLKQTVFRTYHHNKRKMQELYEGGEIPPREDKRLKKHGVEIDGIRFLFNPASFTQTVENIFHYSFLVKEGVGTLKVRNQGIGDNFGNKGDPGGLACHYVDDTPVHPPNTQSIVSLSMQDWRDLVKAYDVKKGDLPYRVGSAQTKSVHLSQQEVDEESSSDEIKEGAVNDEVEESSDEIKEGGVNNDHEESSDEIKEGGVNDEHEESSVEINDGGVNDENEESSDEIKEGAVDDEHEESSVEIKDGGVNDENEEESSDEIKEGGVDDELSNDASS